MKPIPIDSKLSCKLSWASLLAALFVVFIHAPKFESYDSGWQGVIQWGHVYHVGTVAVPAFFSIAGFLLAGHFLQSGWWLKEIKKRLKTLLIPYFIWCGFSVFVFSGLNYILTGQAPTIKHILGSMGFEPFVLPMTPYWFIRELFVFVLLAPVIVKFAVSDSRWIGISFMFGLFILSFASSYLVFKHPMYSVIFFSLLSVKSFFCFFLGAWLRFHPVSVSEKLAAFMFVLYLLICIVHVYVSRFCAFEMGGGYLRHLSLLKLFYFLWLAGHGCQRFHCLYASSALRFRFI